MEFTKCEVTAEMLKSDMNGVVDMFEFLEGVEGAEGHEFYNKGSSLSLFAGDGSLVDWAYANKMKDSELWELNTIYEPLLLRRFPGACVRVGEDSISKLGYVINARKKYDLVVIDNPSCMFGEDYCEHFDVLGLVCKLVKSLGTWLFFNVNARPYNYVNQRWTEKRVKFYKQCGLELPRFDMGHIPEDFGRSFYVEFFKRHGVCVVNMKWKVFANYFSDTVIVKCRLL